GKRKHLPLLAHRDYQAPPLGALMHQAFQTQVDNGIAARMVLHDYDFVCGTDKLNLRGGDHLGQVAHIWRQYNYPLIIERTPYSTGLADKRRAAVLSHLAERGMAVPPELVVIGPAVAIPLRGFEAELIYQNLVQQIQMRGNLPPQGGGGAVIG